MALDTANKLARLAGPVVMNVGNSTVFAGSTGHVYTIRNILAVNNSAGSATIAFGINGIATGNMIVPPTSVATPGRLSTDDMIILVDTDTLQISVTGNAVTVSIYGLDQS